LTAHQFALRKLGADGLPVFIIDLDCKGISDVYGSATAGTHYASAVMGMLDSEKATVHA
jgi:hypothetical protein